MTKAKRSHPPSDWPRPLHICPWTRGSSYYGSLPFYASAVSSAGSSVGHLLPNLSTKSLKSHLSRGLEAGEAAACNKGGALGRALQGGHVGMQARPDQLRMHALRHMKGYSGWGAWRMQALSPQLHPPCPSPGPTVLCRWANIDFLSLSWPVELRAKHRLLSPSLGREGGQAVNQSSSHPTWVRKAVWVLESDVCPLAFAFSSPNPPLPPHSQAHVGLILMFRLPCGCHSACLG